MWRWRQTWSYKPRSTRGSRHAMVSRAERPGTHSSLTAFFLPTPGAQTSSFQTGRRTIHLYCLKPASLWYVDMAALANSPALRLRRWASSQGETSGHITVGAGDRHLRIPFFTPNYMSPIPLPSTPAPLSVFPLFLLCLRELWVFNKTVTREELMHFASHLPGKVPSSVFSSQ